MLVFPLRRLLKSLARIFLLLLITGLMLYAQRGWDVSRHDEFLHVHGNMLKKAGSEVGEFLSISFSVWLDKHKQEPSEQSILA